AISACTRSSRWEQALRLWPELVERGLQPSMVTFGAAASAMGEGQDWRVSLQLLKQLHLGLSGVSLITHNTIIAACERASQWERTLALFGELRRTPEPGVFGIFVHQWTRVAWEGFRPLSSRKSKWRA
ncbi:unnamed protein product, partial [Polarella glacialis]